MNGTVKPSLWNSYISLNKQGSLVYNAKSDSFILLKDSRVIEYIRESKIEQVPDEIKSKLMQGGALIPLDVDELSELDHLIHTVDEGKSAFILIVNPTLQCNFRCWYCYEEHKPQSKMTPSVIRSVQRLTERIIKDNPELKEFDLSFFGGEPLLQFNQAVVPIIEHAASICRAENKQFHIHFTSNGSLVNKEIGNFLKQFPTSFQITLDGGVESHNKTRHFASGKPSFDIILRNIIELASLDIRTLVRINYTLDNLPSVSDILDKFEEIESPLRKKIKIDFQAVWQDVQNQRANPEHKTLLMQLKKRFEQAGFLVSHHAAFNYVLNSCYADKRNEVLVNYNGDVFSCTARDFTAGNRKGFLKEDGTIVWENDFLETKMRSKFKKDICRRCRIAPICGGGCRTKCMENMHIDACNHSFSEEQIDDLILERFEIYFMNDRI